MTDASMPGHAPGEPGRDTARPRLPKAVEADPRAATLLARLASRARPLWKDAAFRIASVEAGDELMATLRSSNQAGFVVRGLEAAERRLAEEERGLKLVRRAAERDAAVRISRLMVITSDGAERFYRNVEALLRRHGPRLFAIRVEVDEHAMGEALFGPGRVARLVMLEHKSAVAEVLLAVALQDPGDLTAL